MNKREIFIEALETHLAIITDEVNRTLDLAKNGAEIAEYKWFINDQEFRCGCNTCGVFIDSVKHLHDVPMGKYAKCGKCNKSPEEQAAEQALKDLRVRNTELEELQRLREKYPYEL